MTEKKTWYMCSNLLHCEVYQAGLLISLWHNTIEPFQTLTNSLTKKEEKNLCLNPLKS